MAEVTLQPAPPESAAQIATMLAEYLDELDLEAPIARASVPLYWREAGRCPFLIRRADEVAGFALVRHREEGFSELAEFSVLPPARGAGVGSAAARLVFARFPGRWRPRAVPTAARFWTRVLKEAGVQSEDLGDGWRAFVWPG